MNIELVRISVRARTRAVKVAILGPVLVPVLGLILSGCASSGARAPVEQRSSADNRAPLRVYRESSPTPAPSRDNADRTVQVTGLGGDSLPREPAPAWSSNTQAATTEVTGNATRSESVPGPAAKSAADTGFAVANPAVVALLNRANREAAAGRQGASAASLERAINIEPGNAWLWHRLAQTRLKQNEPGEAASIAARSNSLAGSNDALRARNWRLIASVHELRGESVAAQAARSKAERLERGTS
ncbi:MAG: hypothetical protein ACI9DC_001381 [Gammaproteobacteria bacterium]|jgi:hypothetical protein